MCEKPLGVRLDDGRAQHLPAVNLIMRYNPLCEAVETIVDRGYLGKPLHAHFVDNAKDESLPPEHWFWVRQKGAVTFIGHRVHFFDLHIDCVTDERGVEALCGLRPATRWQEVERYRGPMPHCVSRNRPREVNTTARDPSRRRRLIEVNGIASLTMAVDARRMADQI